MRQSLIWLVAALALVCAFAPAAAVPPPDLTCKAYVVYDMTADEVMAVHNAQQVQPIASLTKLMTAILVCERLRFDGRYILSPEERETFGVDTMRAEKMLEMMLVPSNNSVCKLAARIISGDETAFAREMNAKALQLGLRNTQFANASGLPREGQQSDVFDVLQLARVAMTYPRIRAAMELHKIELNGHSYDSTLKDLYERHPGLLGGKTGYTRAAGRCLVLHYVSRGREYLVVTLGSKNVKTGFRDAELVLYNHGLYDGPVGAWE
jgi:D-alanyl-D-alanine carboxypeptidase (penicillin-binding protein 5/6)